jgi:hypothetical protein
VLPGDVVGADLARVSAAEGRRHPASRERDVEPPARAKEQRLRERPRPVLGVITDAGPLPSVREADT